MKVSEALKNRRSIRAFQSRSVAPDLLSSIFADAARAPSGGNVQPWKIVILSEERLAEFVKLMEMRLSGTPIEGGEKPEYDVYPAKLQEPYRTARYNVGEQMYGLLGIGREDKADRLKWFANNFRFFGAPAAAFCFVERNMGPPQWSDLGMFLQSAMLLFQENGIDTCAQECWSMYPRTVSEFCEIPDAWMLFCGMAIGYADEDHPVNKLRTERLEPETWLKLL